MPRISEESLSPYQRFKLRWQNCRKCALWKRRTNIVLCRGVVPCDVLFCAEAPGQSEDALGQPMVGPAGRLLDELIAQALFAARSYNTLRLCWTNLLSCIPRWDIQKNEPSVHKTSEPPKFAVEACHERLVEFLKLCRPRLVVLVGSQAVQGLDVQDIAGLDPIPKQCEIVHPARILRLGSEKENPVRANLEQRRAVVTLTDAFEALESD